MVRIWDATAGRLGRAVRRAFGDSDVDTYCQHCGDKLETNAVIIGVTSATYCSTSVNRDCSQAGRIEARRTYSLSQIVQSIQHVTMPALQYRIRQGEVTQYGPDRIRS
tara:strand:- start:1408 stop:1731 length:324 start_codon:yes stop_codon:yes gene_type:complete